MVIRNVLQVFHTYKKEQVYHEKKNHNSSGDSCWDSGGSCDCINSGTDTGTDLMKGTATCIITKFLYNYEAL